MAITQVKIDAGEGAALQRLAYFVKLALSKVDYEKLCEEARQKVEEAKEYERLVEAYRKSVKNGWSGSTKRRAEYLGGTAVRLMEMAALCQKIVDHKARYKVLIPLEVERVRQEYRLSRDSLLELATVIIKPSLIRPK
jgi:hypothetical protein